MGKKKQTFMLIVILISLLLFPLSAKGNPLTKGRELAGEGLGEILDDMLDSVDLESLEEGMDYIGEDGLFNDGGNASDIIESFLKGEGYINLSDVFNRLWSYFASRIREHLKLGVLLGAAALLYALVDKMQDGFGSMDIKQSAFFVIYLAIAAILASALGSFITSVSGTIGAMTSMMQGAMPILLGFLMAAGGASSAALLSPAISLFLGAGSALLSSVIFPMIYIALIFGFLRFPGIAIDTSKLYELSKSVIKWVLGIFFTIFTGLLIIQGAGAAAVDGLTIRTAKYAIKTFVPVAGGSFSDTLSTAVGCSVVIKNAIGAVALIIIVFMALMPLVDMIALNFMLRLTAAITQSITDDDIPDLLTRGAECIGLLSVVLIGCTLMFVMLVSMVMGMGLTILGVS